MGAPPQPAPPASLRPVPTTLPAPGTRRNLYTYTDNLQVIKGTHQLSMGIWFQRLQDNEDTASRQLGVATFTSLPTFLQGTVSQFQVIPDPNELGWRSLFGAFYVTDAIRLRRNLTLQLGLCDEFTTGWNEVSGRAANYITSNGVKVRNTFRCRAVLPRLSGDSLGVHFVDVSVGRSACMSRVHCHGNRTTERRDGGC